MSFLLCGRRAQLWIAIGVLFWVALLPAASAEVASADSGHGSEFAGFPLWKDVPARDFALLKEGQNRLGTRWAVYAYRDARRGRRAREEPCILLARITAQGMYHFSPGCGVPAPLPGSRSMPVSVGMGDAHSNYPGGPWVGESFTGMTFAPEVARVRIEVEPGPAVALQTQYLSARQSKEAHVRRFRYVAFALPRDVCLGRLTGFDDSGAVVLEADFTECPLYGRLDF